MLISTLALALLAAPARPARPANATEWVTVSDYPDAARRYDKEGVVAFALDIDVRGRVTNCTITASSGTSALDVATCRLIRARGRFVPAADADGRAVRGAFASRINWKLPERSPAVIVGANRVDRGMVSANGEVSACEIVEQSGSQEEIGGFCQLARSSREMAQFARGQIGGRPRYVFSQATLSFDGGPPFIAQYERAGVTVVSLVAADFEISQTGVVENCMGSTISGPGFTNLCDGYLRRFVPDRDDAGAPRRRKGRMTMAFFTEEVSGGTEK